MPSDKSSFLIAAILAIGISTAGASPMASASSPHGTASAIQYSSACHLVHRHNYSCELTQHRLRARSLAIMGDTAVKMKEYKKAVEYYSQAMAENPSMSRPNPPPKDRFFLTIDSQVELKACDEYGKTHPSDPYALAIQALLQEEVGVSDGVELFSKSIALKKDLLFTRLFRFESLGGPYADEDTKVALQLAPTDPRAMVNRGTHYSRTQQYDKAQAMFDRAHSVSRPWARVYFNEGVLAFQKGDFERSVALYELGRALEPDSQIFYIEAANALLRLHRSGEALAWLDDAAKAGFDGQEIRSLRCRAFQADGNYCGVIAERLKDPENSLPLFILITSLVLLGHLALVPVSSLAASKW